MKVKYKSSNGQFEVEFDVQTNKQLFEEVAAFQEVFEQNKKGGKNYRFVVRKVGKNKYYELLCLDDNLKLGFGLMEENPDQMFPRRKNHKTGEPIGDWGWHKFEKEDDPTEKK